jgi:hypothetical protein
LQPIIKKTFSEYKNISILKFIEGMTVPSASHS